MSYNANNQQTTFGPDTLTYDLNGNLTSVTDGSDTTTYTWNARNQLTAMSGPGLTASFTYDSFGRRTGKTINSVTTNFVYDGLNPVQEKDGSTVTANLLTGLGIDEFFTRTDGVGVRAFLPDALGSTIALGDNTGTLQTQYTYEPFGVVSQIGASSTNSYKYTGREDDGTGLMYYRARYYHSRFQRFLSEDPIELGSGDLNFYAYVRNSPLLLIDPLGEAGQKGERGRAAGPSGTPNEFKHMKPDPSNPSKVILRDPITGKDVQKAKPPGFDEWWKRKHGRLPIPRCPGPLLIIIDPDAALCAINPLSCT